MFVKIIHDELIKTLGGGAVDVDVRENPSVIFLVGLQGAGKTTTAAKLGFILASKVG
jgi:signal recognition particle subunit SRP54